MLTRSELRQQAADTSSAELDSAALLSNLYYWHFYFICKIALLKKTQINSFVYFLVDFKDSWTHLLILIVVFALQSKLFCNQLLDERSISKLWNENQTFNTKCPTIRTNNDNNRDTSSSTYLYRNSLATFIAFCCHFNAWKLLVY